MEPFFLYSPCALSSGDIIFTTSPFRSQKPLQCAPGHFRIVWRTVALQPVTCASAWTEINARQQEA